MPSLTILAGPNGASYARRAAGYDVQLIYIWVNSADLCIERGKKRVASGGHFVEDEIVRRRYEWSLKDFFGLYLPLADVWQAYDNSAGEGEVLVAEGHRLPNASVYLPALWSEMRQRAG